MRALFFGAVAMLTVSPLAAQSSSGAPCEDAAPLLTPGEQDYCFAIAQAVESAQPQLGIVIAGGNPTLGSNELRGIRLGVLPRFSATVQLSAARVRLPDIEDASTAMTGRIEAPAPALSGSVALGVFPGFSTSPTVGGIGSLDLLGSATWLPFNTIGVDGFAEDAAEFAYGFGARVGLLRESFTTPGISVSLMYRRLNRVRYGDVCPPGAGASLLGVQGNGYDLDAGLCAAPGDPGEFAFDLTDWSGRAVVSKRLLGLDLAAGAGYDRFQSEIEFGLGATPELPLVGVQPVFIRASELDVDSDRWSAFGNVSLPFLLAALVAEVGWMEGGDPIPQFDVAGSDFDPREGILFGSVGLRLSF